MNKINHVAIIMDGNGRWGLDKKKNRNFGHKEGLKAIEKIIQETIKKKIKFLTLYTFSIDNWKRPKKEISYLFYLLEKFLNKDINKLTENKICLKIIGNKNLLPKKLKRLINSSEKLTSNNDKLQINLALNYGSKDEIIYSIKNILKKKIPVNKNNIDKNLYTNSAPDPDILIRTGNTNRLSNFLLWQIAYTEIFFVKKLWPDFNKKDYNAIINKFLSTKRNFGGV